MKLVAADMDGTLLDSKGALDPKFFTLHEEMKEKGVTFVAASGRQYYNLNKLFDSIRDDIVFMAENGTYVVCRSEEWLVVDVPLEAAREVIREVRAIGGIYPILCGKKSAYIEDDDPGFVKQATTYYERCVRVPDLMEIADDQVLKVAVYDREGSATHCLPLLRHFEASLKVVVSGKNWLDFCHRDANKGNALRMIQHRLCVGAEECLAFGDQMNDAEMLQAVTRGYAMENAVDELKRIATHLAPSNDEGGVLTVVASHLG